MAEILSPKVEVLVNVPALSLSALVSRIGRSGSRLARLGALPVALGVSAVGCAGYATVDGYDATYVDPPPPAVVAAPSYRVRDGYIYEARGQYYHMHGGRWVTYRTLPREAVRVEGRANLQRR